MKFRDKLEFVPNSWLYLSCSSTSFDIVRCCTPGAGINIKAYELLNTTTNDD